jgi:serine protease Do
VKYWTKTRRQGEWATKRVSLRALASLSPCLLVSLSWLATGAAKADEPPAAVLTAETNRVETIKRISKPTIAIFDSNGQGGGSGVVISADGYALTNFHVASPTGPAMKVGLSDGRLVDAVVVGVDPGGDVALIKLLSPAEKSNEAGGNTDGPQKNEFPVAELGDSDTARVGDWVYVAGNPFLLADDFQPTITYGIISGVHRYQYPAGTLLEYADCLQTDAAINPGNSGGPLFDSAGRLIGINGRGSFEKRGRVNVGVGYAISINQIKRFLGLLHSGRVVDHASLGATVTTGRDGRVVVDEILEDSDAFRRGLRYDDEIVRFGGREINSVNAFKNALGTYPGGWRVPITYRRDGKEFERRVRLTNFHRDGELQALLESEQGQEEDPRGPRRGEPRAPDDEPMPESPRRGDGGRRRGGPPDRGGRGRRGRGAAEMAPAVKSFFEERAGYANYWFNRYHQQRVWNAFLARGDFADAGWNWQIRGTLVGGGDVEIQLAETSGAIVMPDGRSEAEFKLSLTEETSPPRSGGLLAALHVWQRLLLLGPRRFGEVHYVGKLPWNSEGELADCLGGTYAGVDTQFYFDSATGEMIGLEMRTSDDVDPCEIYFSDSRPVEGRSLPHRWIVRHGDEVFAELTLTSWTHAAPTPVPERKD